MSFDEPAPRPGQKPVPPIPGMLAPKEPLLTVGLITTIVTAGLALLVAVGVPVDDDLQAALLTFVAVLAPVVVAWVGRGTVWSPHTVRQAVLAERQRNTGGGAELL